MVIQGSNNVPLNVTVIEKGTLVPLNGSYVSLIIKAGERKITKTATIIGTGRVSTLLTSNDLSSSGNYFVWAIVSYTDGRKFISEPTKFIVGSMP